MLLFVDEEDPKAFPYVNGSLNLVVKKIPCQGYDEHY